jgi:DNA-binding response OmpR family regulator
VTDILIVEDEDGIADFMARGLKGEGYVTTRAADGETALSLLKENSFDVVLLDIMLPGMSGHDVCSRMRLKQDFTPVLMLTALDGVDEKVAGLDKGADDYLAKPFDFNELIARIKALTRRTSEYDTPEGAQEIDADAVSLDMAGLCLVIDGERIELSTKEHDFMSMLTSNAGKVLSRERILNSVWGLNEDPMTNTVDVYVRRLRAKLGIYSDRIVSVRGVGYRYM